jgi:hypothetical protein
MPINPWHFLFVGYFFTISIEIPILMLGLSSRHSWKRRLLAGIWINACSYPVVVLSMPILLQYTPGNRAAYLWVAETFAPVSECVLFWIAFGSRQELGRRSMWQDFATIILANLASFGAGEVMIRWHFWDELFGFLYRELPFLAPAGI